MIFILLLIVIGVVLWYSGILNPRGDRGLFQSMQHRTDALDIAKERYARGEIDKEEYNALHRDIVG